MIIIFIKSCANSNDERPIGEGVRQPQYFYDLDFILLNLDFNKDDILRVEIKAVDEIKTIGSFLYLSNNVGTCYKNRLHIMFLPHNNFSSKKDNDNFIENTNTIVKGKFIEVNNEIGRLLWGVFTNNNNSYNSKYDDPNWDFYDGYKGKENRKLRGVKRTFNLKVFKNDSFVIFDKNFTVKTEKNLEKKIEYLETEIFEMEGMSNKIYLDGKVWRNSGKNLRDYFNENPEDIGKIFRIDDVQTRSLIYLHRL
ncbi:hypothetical protein [Ichthyobacterium seriolicida]|uniref:Uncharacterized protein n=1 Tax=Ichthyobacterium seriolicida TaxID=242600 RepID=A0A1J1DYC9_9FLAO|nr:hypothetical protein [Ichthyobacterium seriolicida]BAV94865.1 hypothetical protein JBKA6_0852 [Ichthyobacterium seriolicida]